MSMGALLFAVRDRIRDQLQLTEAECEIMPDGFPAPRCGQFFAAVHEADWTTLGPDSGSDWDLDETMGVSVTCSFRTGAYPFDKVGPELLYKPGEGAEHKLRQIIVAVHQDQANVRAVANTRIADEWGDTPDGFCTTLVCANPGRWEWKTDDWFNSYVEADFQGAGTSPYAGIARVLTFAGARRIQTITGME